MTPEELLRRHEPVVRLTQGELFVPSPVEDYLSRCALVDGHGDAATVLAEPGTLTPDALAAHGARHWDRPLSLRYVQRPMTRHELRQWRRSDVAESFRRSHGAAAAGLLARAVAALMRLSLLLRGRVPGGHTAAAFEQARTAPQAGTCHYYGRVSRDGGYVVLSYWLFYPMNDWRSSFGGVNDHEADWEHVSVLLAEQRTTLTPVWVVFASHNETGADLRRRWDDPELELVGEHPVVYAGAGSHSAACLPGEYLVSVAPDLPPWLQRLRHEVARIVPWWADDGDGIGIPFIDYRRGDGLSIGPGEDRTWHCHVIDDTTPWVRDYRGLWGLDTGDRLGGERAPAGPRYERDGSVRPAWERPVAWVDLDGEPATPHEAERLRQCRPVRLEAELAAAAHELDDVREQLREATVADRVAGTDPSPSPERRELDARVRALRDRIAQLHAGLDLSRRHAGEPPARPGAQDHLRHRALPMAEDTLAQSRAVRAWASASTAVLFTALGLLLIAGGRELLGPVMVVVVAMLLVEALLRRRLTRLVVNITVAGLVVAAVAWVVWLLLDNVRLGAGVLLLVAAAYMAVQAASDALRHPSGPRTT
jgi:hypothetical protein